MGNKTSSTMDWIAFLPDPLFNVTADAMLQDLAEGGVADKTLEYLMGSTGGIRGFYSVDGKWTAKWQYNYEKCEPGYSGYLNNALGSIWDVEDLVHGKNPFPTVKKLLE